MKSQQEDKETGRLLPCLPVSLSTHLAIYLALLIFWTATLSYLSVVPLVHEDEPWQSSPGYSLITRGVYGSDLFTGFYGIENHYYHFMPLFPLLVGASFKWHGVGLFQARFVSASLALLTLCLTYAVGNRLFGRGVGAIAVWLLLTIRLRAVMPTLAVTGIPMLDVARVVRYDVAVPVFGLAALYLVVYTSEMRTRMKKMKGFTIFRSIYPLYPSSILLDLSVGLLVGLAGLAHLYGLFWGPALAVTLLWRDGWRAWPRLVWVGLGIGLAWMPWWLYVAQDYPAYVGQLRNYANRFDLYNPLFYLTNLLTEPQRYVAGSGLGSAGWLAFTRVGSWLTLLGLPCAILALGRRAWRGDAAARSLIAPLIVIQGLFAALLLYKTFNYAVTLLPLAALAGAWGIHTGYRILRKSEIQNIVLVLALAVILEAGGQWIGIGRTARHTTAYTAYTTQIASHIPADTRALGLHTLWLGLHQFDYRSFWLPFILADAQYVEAPRPLDAALEQIAPSIVLIDPQIRATLAAPTQAGDPALFWGWMARHNAQLIATVDDAAYGLVEIYRLDTP